MKQCSTCKHWKYDAFLQEIDVTVGVCRRYPPVFIGGEFDTETIDVDCGELRAGLENWQQPVVFDDSICGEYSHE